MFRTELAKVSTPTLLKFGIVIKIDRVPIRLRVEQIVASPITEHFLITARNKTFTIQSNRPLLRGKGIKHRKPNYKIIEGDTTTSGIRDAIFNALHAYLIKLEQEGS
jgi:hypothetical protein